MNQYIETIDMKINGNNYPTLDEFIDEIKGNSDIMDYKLTGINFETVFEEE